MRDLLGELEDLIDLLVPLTQVLEIIPMQDYDIELPLIRSSSICLEFQQDLIDCYLDSGDDRMSFQSWAIFRSMNNDIDSLRRLLAGYRLTIEVALANATM